jgi:hypothetical protein
MYGAAEWVVKTKLRDTSTPDRLRSGILYCIPCCWECKFQILAQVEVKMALNKNTVIKSANPH